MKLIAIFFLMSGIAKGEIKYVDLTGDKWNGAGDPPVEISEMSISVGNSIFRESDRYTRASWFIYTPLECKKFTVNFQIEDRVGKLITSEKKYYNRNVDLTIFNKEASNILYTTEGNYAARFKKRFDSKLYTTVKYWLSNIYCPKAKTIKVNDDPDKIALSLEEHLKGAEKLPEKKEDLNKSNTDSPLEGREVPVNTKPNKRGGFSGH